MKDGASQESLDNMKVLNGDGGETESVLNTWRVALPAALTVPEAA